MSSIGLPATESTCPPSSAVSASPPLLKRTRLNFVPVACSSSATAMSSAVPAEPTEIVRGLDFAAATMSAADVYADPAFTASR